MSRRTLTFANGSRIIASHFQHESDVDAYLGLEYDVIGIEEAATLMAIRSLWMNTRNASGCRSAMPRPSRPWLAGTI